MGETMPETNAIVRLARRMRALSALALAGWVGLLLWLAAMLVLDPAAFDNLATADLPRGMTAPAFGWGTRLALFANAVVITAASALVLWQGVRLFNDLAKGQVFGETTARHIRMMGFAFLISAGTSILGKTVMILLVTLGNPPGQRQLAISIGSAEILAVIVAGLLLAMGHILVHGAQIEADNRGFV